MRRDTRDTAEYQGEEVVAERELPATAAPRSSALQHHAMHPHSPHMQGAVSSSAGSNGAGGSNGNGGNGANGHGKLVEKGTEKGAEKGYALAEGVKIQAISVVAESAKLEMGVVNRIAARAKPAATNMREQAILKGYTGDPCPTCQHATLVRNGACLKCMTCGAATGCS